MGRRRDGMLNLVFGAKLLSLSARELSAIICNDLARDAKPVYDSLEKPYCGLHAYILNRLSFHPLGERINPDEKESETSRSSWERS